MLREKYGEFEMNPDDRVLSKEELLEKVKGRDAVLCLLTDPIDREVLEAAGPQCKIFSNYAVGYNNVDVQSAGELGIMVSNTPGVLTDATADHAAALLFAAARRIVESDIYARAGKFKGWGPLHFLGQDITGKTLGIVGAGRIGGAFARKMARGFDMKILYTNRGRNEELEQEIGAELVELPKLLAESDFVSVHCPMMDETHHLIGEKEFGMMKPSCVFINTARGPIVDEAALASALKNGKIFAAGLDVYEEEPKIHPDLLGLDNVVLAPHTASATFWTRTRMAEMAAQNLIDALEGRMPEYCVNKEFLKSR